MGVVLVHQRLDRRVHRRPDDAAAIARVGVEHRRDRLLQREAQVILASARGRVHQDAHPHQPLDAAVNACASRPVITPMRQQLLRIGRAEAGLRRPATDAEIAQAARAVLQIGLEQEDRVAEAAVAFLLLGAQARHEVLRRGLGDARAEGGQELVGQRPIAGQEARVEQRRRRRQIVGRQRQRLIVGAHGVPGVDLRVPQRIQDRLRQLLDVGARRLRAQHQQVEIGERRQLRAAEAAGREDRDRRLALGDLAPGDVDDDRVDVGRQHAGCVQTDGGSGSDAATRARVGRVLARGRERLCNAAVGHRKASTLPESQRTGDGRAAPDRRASIDPGGACSTLSPWPR